MSVVSRSQPRLARVPLTGDPLRELTKQSSLGMRRQGGQIQFLLGISAALDGTLKSKDTGSEKTNRKL